MDEREKMIRRYNRELARLRREGMTFDKMLALRKKYQTLPDQKKE